MSYEYIGNEYENKKEKGGSGEKENGAPKTKIDPKTLPEVMGLLSLWDLHIGKDATRSEARIWIARRLGLAPQGLSGPVTAFSLADLTRSIENYAESLRRHPTDCLYAVRNFFGTKSYCETYADPEWKPPTLKGRAAVESIAAPEPAAIPPCPNESIPQNLTPCESQWQAALVQIVTAQSVFADFKTANVQCHGYDSAGNLWFSLVSRDDVPDDVPDLLDSWGKEAIKRGLLPKPINEIRAVLDDGDTTPQGKDYPV